MRRRPAISFCHDLLPQFGGESICSLPLDHPCGLGLEFSINVAQYCPFMCLPQSPPNHVPMALVFIFSFTLWSDPS